MTQPTGPLAPNKLVLSIAEAAEVLGVSDDLIYELTARDELPCLRLGRRKVIPTVAIQAVIDGCLEGFRITERQPSRRHSLPSCRTIAVQRRGGSVTRTARIELRAEPEREERIREAARLANQSVSSFVLDAASERAEEVLRTTMTTTVPVDIFEQLHRALGEPPVADPALQRTARRKRRVVQA